MASLALPQALVSGWPISDHSELVCVPPDPLLEDDPDPEPDPDDENEDDPLDLLPEDEPLEEPDPLLEPLPDPLPEPLPDPEPEPEPEAPVSPEPPPPLSLWTQTPSARNVLVPGIWIATVRAGAST